MKVLLVSPSFENPRYPLYLPSENLGIAYLTSHLRMNDVEVDIIDANMLGLSATQIVTDLKQSDYDVVGVAISFQTLVDEARQIAMNIKTAMPTAHITVGGHFPTFRHGEILEADHHIDTVVRADGEDTLLDLVRALEGNMPLENVSGLSFRNSHGKVIMNPPRPPRRDLDTLPYPARDTLVYIRDIGHPWPTQISSSRGCYASCAFCDIRSFYGRTWRSREPRNLVDEIEWLKNTYGSKTFRFTDDEFIGPRPSKGIYGPDRALEIAHEIIGRGLEVELMIDARPEAVDRELFKVLKDAGTIDCLVGIESGVDRILSLYSKGSTAKRNAQAIEILRDLGIALNLGFIMFDPRMTFAELRANYGFLVSNNIVTVESLRSWLWPLFGTPVVDQLRAAGLVTEETLGDIVYRFQDQLVGKVFSIISHCTKLTSKFEHHLFLARKFHHQSLTLFQGVIEDNLRLWIEIFESAVNDPDGVDFSWVERRASSMLERAVSIQNALPAVQFAGGDQ